MAVKVGIDAGDWAYRIASAPGTCLEFCGKPEAQEDSVQPKVRSAMSFAAIHMRLMGQAVAKTL